MKDSALEKLRRAVLGTDEALTMAEKCELLARFVDLHQRVAAQEKRLSEKDKEMAKLRERLATRSGALGSE